MSIRTPARVGGTHVECRGIRLHFDDSALQRKCYRMRTTICTKFGHDVLDVALGRILGDRKLIGDELVGISGSDQGQNLDFPFRQDVVRSMHCELQGDPGIYFFLSGMNRTDCIQQILSYVTLQHVCLSPSLECALSEGVPCVRSEYNDSRDRIFTSNSH